MRVAALFLGLMAGLFALLAPSALRTDLLSPFLELWPANEQAIGTIVWYAIPAVAILGALLATVTPGYAALLLAAAAIGWASVGLAVPEIFDYRLMAPVGAAGLASLVALIAGELAVRRRRIARRRARTASEAITEEEDEIEREAALRMDPVMIPRAAEPEIAPPRRTVALTLDDVSVMERPSGPPPRWQDLDAPAEPKRRLDVWGEAIRHEEEPETEQVPEPSLWDDRDGGTEPQGFRWQPSDAPPGQRARPPVLTATVVQPARAQQPEPAAAPAREALELWPEPQIQPQAVAAEKEQRPLRRRTGFGGALVAGLAAVVAVLVIGALLAGGYLLYRDGWVDRLVALVQPQPAVERTEAPVAAAVTPAAVSVSPAPAAPAVTVVPPPAPTAVAEATAPQTYGDPFAYCRAVGTVDFVDARYTGPTLTEPIAEALSLTTVASRDRVRWRCDGGVVVACASYIGPICDIIPTEEEMQAYCAVNPNAPQMLAPGGPWSCVNGVPQLPKGSNWNVDARGFVPQAWVVVIPPASPAG